VFYGTQLAFSDMGYSVVSAAVFVIANAIDLLILAFFALAE
jgi:hypothetical protein